MTFVRVCTTCILVYAFLSCLYTTSFLLLCPFVSDCSTSFALDISRLYARLVWTRRLSSDTSTISGLSTSSYTSALALSTQELVRQQAAGYKDVEDFLSSFEAATADSVLYWPVSQSESTRLGQILQGISSAEPDRSLGWFAMSESLFLSKSFSGSMHPMKIFPYYYKASDTFDEDDITTTTLVTPNRFEVLRKLALRYEGMVHAHLSPEVYGLGFSGYAGYMRLYLKSLLTPSTGPLSVTVHIPLPTSAGKSSSLALHNSLLALHALVTNSPGLTARADIHLVLSPFPRAFNTWRNLARLLARTTYILLLDVDFAVCTDWRASVRALLRDREHGLARRVREGSTALVLPAFEYVKQVEGRNQDAFPKDKHVRTIYSFLAFVSCLE
jgi:Glycosyl-transferase for dystroglycan